MNDFVAIQELRSGSEEALSWLINRYSSYVQSIACKILGPYMNHMDIEEVAADVFFTMWKNAERIQPDAIKGWLGTVSRNKSINKLREFHPDLVIEDDIIQVCYDDPSEEVIKKEERRLIRETVLSMVQPQQEIFLRHYYFEQPVSQIAAEMEMNISTVKTHLFRGRKKLRTILEESFTHPI